MSSSRKRQVKSGRGADKGKRNPRTYYAISKDSLDIYRFSSHDDRQTAIETQELEPLTAQEFLQFQGDGNARIHVMPPQVKIMETPAAKAETPVVSTQTSSPQSYTESPQQNAQNVEASTDSSSTFPVSERITEAAQNAVAKVGELSPSITMSIEQCKQLIVAAIVEALQIIQAQHGGKSVVPAATGTITGEQPAGNRNQSH